MKKTLLFLLFICTSLYQIDANAQTPTTLWADNAVITWYNTTSTTFSITTPNQLAGLAILVEGGNNFSGKNNYDC